MTLVNGAPPKRSNTGLIIGLSLGGFFLLLILAVAFAASVASYAPAQRVATTDVRSPIDGGDLSPPATPIHNAPKPGNDASATAPADQPVAPAEPQKRDTGPFGFLVDHQMQNIEDKVANDQLDEYQMAVRGGDKMEVCVHAGILAAAYLQAKDEDNYTIAKKLEKADCRRAGIPSMG